MEALGSRRRRVRARGGGDALLMIAQQQLDKPQAASEGAAARVAACGPEGMLTFMLSYRGAVKSAVSLL